MYLGNVLDWLAAVLCDPDLDLGFLCESKDWK
jgi:hypothetical protein